MGNDRTEVQRERKNEKNRRKEMHGTNGHVFM